MLHSAALFSRWTLKLADEKSHKGSIDEAFEDQNSKWQFGILCDLHIVLSWESAISWVTFRAIFYALNLIREIFAVYPIKEADNAFETVFWVVPRFGVDTEPAADAVAFFFPLGRSVCGHPVSGVIPIHLPDHGHVVRVEISGQAH